jgi:hypothetical protein
MLSTRLLKIMTTDGSGFQCVKRVPIREVWQEARGCGGVHITFWRVSPFEKCSIQRTETDTINRVHLMQYSVYSIDTFAVPSNHTSDLLIFSSDCKLMKKNNYSVNLPMKQTLNF